MKASPGQTKHAGAARARIGMAVAATKPLFTTSTDFIDAPLHQPTMSLSSFLSLLSALILSFTVLSAGQAKITNLITPSIHQTQISKDTKSSSLELYLPFSPATRRKLRGVADIICGILLLWPSARTTGAATSFLLLVVSAVGRIADGMSLLPPLTMMGLSAVVWFF